MLPEQSVKLFHYPLEIFSNGESQWEKGLSIFITLCQSHTTDRWNDNTEVAESYFDQFSESDGVLFAWGGSLKRFRRHRPQGAQECLPWVTVVVRWARHSSTDSSHSLSGLKWPQLVNYRLQG
jgi:hypothetical protein